MSSLVKISQIVLNNSFFLNGHFAIIPGLKRALRLKKLEPPLNQKCVVSNVVEILLREFKKSSMFFPPILLSFFFGGGGLKRIQNGGRFFWGRLALSPTF